MLGRMRKVSKCTSEWMKTSLHILQKEDLDLNRKIAGSVVIDKSVQELLMKPLTCWKSDYSSILEMLAFSNSSSQKGGNCFTPNTSDTECVRFFPPITNSPTLWTRILNEILTLTPRVSTDPWSLRAHWQNQVW